MKKESVRIDGQEVDSDVAVNLMDDELRERLHDIMAPCDPQEFIDAYIKAHAKKFGEEFIVN